MVRRLLATLLLIGGPRLARGDWTPYDSGALLPESAFYPPPPASDAAGDCPAPAPSARVALGAAVEDLERDEAGGRVFVCLNGANEGVWLERTEGCLGTLALAAARALGAPPEATEPFRGSRAPLYLYGASGLPVSSEAHVDREGGVLHVLLEGEVFVWPGVREGFRWTASGFALETLSLRPRVIMVHGLLNATVAADLIQGHERSLQQSPERHYSESFKKEAYRTSETAAMRFRRPSVLYAHSLTQQVARLPFATYAEALQLLRYRPEQYYRPHHDLFHHFRLPSEAEFAAARPLRALLAVRDAYLAARAPGRWAAEAEGAWDAPLAAFAAAHWDAFAALAPSVAALPPSAKASLRQWMASNAAENRGGILRELLRTHPDAVEAVRAAARAKNAEDGFGESAGLEDGAHCTAVQGRGEAPPAAMPWENRVEMNRFCTLLHYLNDVDGGGHTVFPDADDPVRGRAARYDNSLGACEKGLRVAPEAGGAVLFYHRTADLLRKEDLSRHMGCPPERGTKYAINSFVFNGPAVPYPCPGPLCFENA